MLDGICHTSRGRNLQLATCKSLLSLSWLQFKVLVAAEMRRDSLSARRLECRDLAQPASCLDGRLHWRSFMAELVLP